MCEHSEDLMPEMATLSFAFGMASCAGPRQLFHLGCWTPSRQRLLDLISLLLFPNREWPHMLLLRNREWPQGRVHMRGNDDKLLKFDLTKSINFYWLYDMPRFNQDRG